MSKLRILVNCENGIIYAPYDKEFVAAMKSRIGGAKWDSSKGAWVVPTASVNKVREIMLEIWGETDFPSTDRVDIKLTAESIGYTGEELTVGGIKIASVRWGKLSLEDGVEIDGPISVGGSRKNPSIRGFGHVVVTVRDIPRALATKAVEECGRPHSDWAAEIIERTKNNNANQAQALREEKERLLARIAEIDKVLETI